MCLTRKKHNRGGTTQSQKACRSLHSCQPSIQLMQSHREAIDTQWKP
jgi:hypothetical protein